MLIRGLVPLAFVLAVAGSASAEVKSATPTGFEVVTMTTISAPAGVYAALGEVGRWWSPSHTFSRDAGNLSMELHAGGCFCERLKDGGSVQLLQVVYAAQGEGLRLRGALGSLQTEGVDGTLNWTLKPPQKLRRGQIPGEIGTLKPTLPGEGPRERVQNAHRAPRASRPVNERSVPPMQRYLTSRNSSMPSAIVAGAHHIARGVP